MPALPKIELTAPMSDEAEPESPDTCDSIRNRLGGAMKLEAMVLGSSVAANAQGLSRPSVQTRTPLTIMTAKPGLPEQSARRRRTGRIYKAALKTSSPR